MKTRLEIDTAIEKFAQLSIEDFLKKISAWTKRQPELSNNARQAVVLTAVNAMILYYSGYYEALQEGFDLKKILRALEKEIKDL